MEIENYDVLLVMNQCTGFGDNYGNIYSSFVGYDKLKKSGLKCCLLFNADTNKYFGYNFPEKSFYEQIFDFKKFEKNVKFYKEVPNQFYLYKDVGTTYLIYLNQKLKNNKVINEINNLNFVGYTHHTVKRNFKNLENEYFGLNFINSKFTKISKEIKKQYGKFIGIHIRMPDGVESDKNLNKSITDRFSQLVNRFPNHKFLISGLGFDLKKLKINNDKIIDVKKYLGDNLDFYEYDITEMCLFFESDFIYSYCNWDSAFLSYSYLRKLKGGKNKDFINNLL